MSFLNFFYKIVPDPLSLETLVASDPKMMPLSTLVSSRILLNRTLSQLTGASKRGNGVATPVSFSTEKVISPCFYQVSQFNC